MKHLFDGLAQLDRDALAAQAREVLRPQQTGARLYIGEHSSFFLVCEDSRLVFARQIRIGLELQADDSGQGRFALIFTRPEEEAGKLAELDDAAFLEHLQQSFGDAAGDFTRVGRRQVYPLVRYRAREQVRPGLVILGNAAHTLHPVAGQGFNLAVRDVIPG